MKTCIEIRLKDNSVIKPKLQFEYSDIVEPKVYETDDKIIISYFREMLWDEIEISEAIPEGVHIKIFNHIIVHNCHITNGLIDDDLDVSDFIDSDGNKLIDPTVRYLTCYAYGGWGVQVPNTPCHAVMYFEGNGVSENEITSRLDDSLRILRGEPLYMHNHIEIDKQTGEDDLMGMVAYLREDECTNEQLEYDCENYSSCEYQKIGLEKIISSY